MDIKKVIAAVVLAAVLALAACSNSSNTELVEGSEYNAGRFKSEEGSCYIITDTKTGVQYLGWSVYEGGAGVCVLVDADGKPLVSHDEG